MSEGHKRTSSYHLREDLDAMAERVERLEEARPVDVPRLVRPLSDAEILAGRLLAFIKVNHKRGTFAVCTDEQIFAHLKPFEDELNAIKAND